jgi:hypothetical protein
VIAMRALRSILVRCSVGVFMLLQGAELAPGFAQPLPHAKTTLVEFENSAFPYSGDIPEKNLPFLDAADGDRRGHTSPRGGVYWEDRAYSDRHALLFIPKKFDPHQPVVLIVYLHGNLARLERDVRRRQQVPRQVAESGLNAVLVVPQLAVDALDSSAGRFWHRGAFNSFLDEAARRLATLWGDDSIRPVFADAPVWLVAYSGGYLAAAFSLAVGGADARMRGVILLDALYGETEKFRDWILRHREGFFISAHSPSTLLENIALQQMLEASHIPYTTALPPRIDFGTVAFPATGPEVVHNDFVTRAWGADPLKELLARLPGPHAVSSADPRRLRRR